MLNDLLNIADRYAQGIQHVQHSREQWLLKHKEVRDRLTVIASYLNEKATYQQGFFVDTLHAFNQEIHGTSADIPSVTFRSGDMPMLVRFRNSMGEKKDYVEEGFSITFNPTITGHVVVLLAPHSSDLNPEKPPFTTLSVIDEPEHMTADMVDGLVKAGMEAAFHSSFTGMSEPEHTTEHTPEIPMVKRNPIGFKRYETTQKA